MAIEIIVTNAGRAALINAVNTGTNAVTITQLGVTAAVFAPNAAQVALPGEIKRIASVAGIVVADDQIHVTASDVTTDAYTMRGFGLYLNDGTLFAIYGQAGAILNKTAESMMLLAADIAFADIDAELIEFGDTNFVLPAATTEILGLVELATNAEAQAGTDATRVLTPLAGKQSVLGWLLSQDGSGSGLDADLLDGQHGAYYLPTASYTAADVRAKLITVDGSGSGVDADLLDGQHASAFASAGHTHGTMAEQDANAVAITGGSIVGTSLTNVQGNVGFGIAAPARPLHVKSGSAELLRLETTTARGGGLCFQQWIDATGVKGAFGYSGANDQLHLVNALYAPLMFGTNNTFRMTIDQDGKVGVGTITPQATLDIRGDAWIRDAGSSYLHIYSVADLPSLSFCNSTALRIVHNDATEIGRFTSTGRLGIGTATPIARLHVHEPSAAANVAWAGNTNNGCGVGMIAAAKPGVTAHTGTNLYFGGNFNGGLVDLAILSNTSFNAGAHNTADIGSDAVRWKAAHFHSAVNIAGNPAWHSGNDGSGSGLDADLLDGQHGAYYLPAASYTAADVLAKLLGVDGAGSALDADLLDGQHAADFVKYSDFTGANQSKAQSGYQKLPGGMIMQWGRFNASANSSTAVTLPIAFPGLACAAVVSGTSSASGDAKDNPPATYSLTLTTLTVYSADDGSTPTHYIAFGY